MKVVRFSAEDKLHPTFRIENCTSLAFNYFQRGCRIVDELLPYTSCAFAWDMRMTAGCSRWWSPLFWRTQRRQELMVQAQGSRYTQTVSFDRAAVMAPISMRSPVDLRSLVYHMEVLREQRTWVLRIVEESPYTQPRSLSISSARASADMFSQAAAPVGAVADERSLCDALDMHSTVRRAGAKPEQRIVVRVTLQLVEVELIDHHNSESSRAGRALARLQLSKISVAALSRNGIKMVRLSIGSIGIANPNPQTPYPEMVQCDRSTDLCRMSVVWVLKHDAYSIDAPTAHLHEVNVALGPIVLTIDCQMVLAVNTWLTTVLMGKADPSLTHKVAPARTRSSPLIAAISKKLLVRAHGVAELDEDQVPLAEWNAALHCHLGITANSKKSPLIVYIEHLRIKDADLRVNVCNHGMASGVFGVLAVMGAQANLKLPPIHLSRWVGDPASLMTRILRDYIFAAISVESISSRVLYSPFRLVNHPADSMLTAARFGLRSLTWGIAQLTQTLIAVALEPIVREPVWRSHSLYALGRACCAPLIEPLAGLSHAGLRGLCAGLWRGTVGAASLACCVMLHKLSSLSEALTNRLLPQHGMYHEQPVQLMPNRWGWHAITRNAKPNEQLVSTFFAAGRAIILTHNRLFSVLSHEYLQLEGVVYFEQLVAVEIDKHDVVLWHRDSDKFRSSVVTQRIGCANGAQARMLAALVCELQRSRAPQPALAEQHSGSSDSLKGDSIVATRERSQQQTGKLLRTLTATAMHTSEQQQRAFLWGLGPNLHHASHVGSTASPEFLRTVLETIDADTLRKAFGSLSTERTVGLLGLGATEIISASDESNNVAIVPRCAMPVVTWEHKRFGGNALSAKCESSLLRGPSVNAGLRAHLDLLVLNELDYHRVSPIEFCLDIRTSAILFALAFAGFRGVAEASIVIVQDFARAYTRSPTPTIVLSSIMSFLVQRHGFSARLWCRRRHILQSASVYWWQSLRTDTDPPRQWTQFQS